MTFFGWPSWPKRTAGSGQVTTVHSPCEGSLDYWNSRLRKLGMSLKRTSRFGNEGIVLADPDGIELELVGDASDERWVPWKDSPVDQDHAIRGFHSVTMTVPNPRRRSISWSTTMRFTRPATRPADSV